MDFLKKLLPLSFHSADKDGFIKSLVIYGAAMLATVVIGILLGGIPVINKIVAAANFVVNTYATGGIAVSILVFVKVIKD